MSDLQKMKNSALAGELDINFAVDGEEKTKNHVDEYLETNGGIEVDLDQQRQRECTPPHADSRYENSGSPYDKHQSVSTEFDHDDLKSAKMGYDGQRMQPLFEENNYQGEMDELHGSHFHKSSFQYKTQTFQSERGTEDSAHSQESPLIADTNQAEELEGSFDLGCPNTISEDQKVKDAYFKKSQCEFIKPISSAIEEEATDNQTGKAFSYPRSPSCDSEPKKEDYSYLRNSPSKGIKLDMPLSGSCSPRSSSKQSISPVTRREMSASPERSPCTHQSPNGHKPMSSQERIQSLSLSPVSHRRRKASFPERSALESEIPPQHHFSPAAGRKFASPHKSRRRSHHKDDFPMKRMSPSPKRHYSPQDHRRRDRSVSRSPARRRDTSSGYRRDYRDRFRSRPPNTIDHHRSSRRRYSPRRRSPSGHHSRRQSPRQRPWSPPPNRRTGMGEPGKNLFVAGFSFLTTEIDLERKFSRFGRVRDVRIVRDKRSGDSRGFGFLSLEKDEDADAAIRALDETEWNGRIILVEKSKSPGR